jgi:hypothetical protein
MSSWSLNPVKRRLANGRIDVHRSMLTARCYADARRILQHPTVPATLTFASRAPSYATRRARRAR